MMMMVYCHFSDHDKQSSAPYVLPPEVSSFNDQMRFENQH